MTRLILFLPVCWWRFRHGNAYSASPTIVSAANGSCIWRVDP